MIDSSSPFDSLLDALQEMQAPLDDYGKRFISNPAIQTVILNLNREQMDAGLRGDGTEITPDYTPFTKYLKALKGESPDIVTLRDTGEFHADLRVEYSEDDARVYDVNEKTAKLVEKYGDEIFGLMEVNEERISGLLLPNMEGYARQVLLPKMLER